MPKFVDLRLNRISADFFPPDPERTVEIRGRVFGTTFNVDPFEEKSQKDIFTFRDGPIRIAHGQEVEIPLSSLEGGEDVRFRVSTPSTEPPRLNGQWLKFGGELHNFGSNFKEMHTNFIHTPPEGFRYLVRIESGDQEMRLDFTLTVDGIF